MQWIQVSYRRFGTASRSCFQWLSSLRTLKMGPIGCPATPVTTDQLCVTSRKSQGLHTHRGGKPEIMPLGMREKFLESWRKSSFVRPSEGLGCAVSLARSEDLQHINSCCLCIVK